MRKETSTNSINHKMMVEKCGMAYTLSVIGGRWKVSLLWTLSFGKLRYGTLRDKFSVVSERILVLQLKELESDGLVKRIVYPEVPPRVEYELTDEGLSLRPILQSLSLWGDERKASNGMQVEECTW
jgi:DNA-binding HxlR family transcriptional regulator